MNGGTPENGSREHWGPARSRTVMWHQPGPATVEGLSLAGIDCIRAVIDGTLPTPPLESQLQFRFLHVDHGRVVVACTPEESTYNGLGTVHGGLLCALLDVVSGCAMHSTLPSGKGYTSLEIKVSYLRSVSVETGTLTATGTVVKAGSRVGFTEGMVTDAAGRAIAMSTSTLLAFDL